VMLPRRMVVLVLDHDRRRAPGPEAVREVVRRYGVYVAKTAEGAIDHTLLTSIIDPRGVLRVQYLGMRFDPTEFRRDLLSLVAK